MDVSENSGTPKSSILIGFSIIFTIHFEGTTIFWKHLNVYGKYTMDPTKNWINILCSLGELLTFTGCQFSPKKPVCLSTGGGFNPVYPLVN